MDEDAVINDRIRAIARDEIEHFARFILSRLEQWDADPRRVQRDDSVTATLFREALREYESDGLGV